MRYKKLVLILSVLVCSILLIFGFKRYKVQQEKIDYYRQIALEEQQHEREQWELERNSNFYEKLKSGFDTSILVLGNSIALSEGATEEVDWIRILEKKIESKYESNIWHKNMACRYTGYEVGYTQIATLNDSREYDAVIICYPACTGENQLIQYEAILNQVKKKYQNAAIIGVITNFNQNTDSKKTIELIEQYDGLYIDMHEMIDENLIDHEFYPNDKGYELYADSVLKKIVAAVDDKKEISTTIKPLRSDLTKYQNCIYVPLRKCRKISENTVVIDLENFSGEICIQAEWTTGNKAYDIYLDYGKWLTRNEINCETDCWYDSFMFHDIPKADKEIMIQFSSDASLSEVKGVYLISEDPVKLH